MRYGREEPTTVYRVVYRDANGEWVQYATYNSRTARPYVNAGTAKGIATDASNYRRNLSTEWAVQKSELNWEPL